MADYSISISATFLTGVITLSINVIRSSTMDKRTLRALIYPRILIWFARLIHLMTMRSATNFAHSENGSTSHILIPLYIVLMSLRLFEAAKLVILSLKMIGTSFVDIPPCFKTQSPASTPLPTQYTWIAEHMWLITMKLIGIFFVSKHHKRPKMQAINATLDKRSWIRMLSPYFFFFVLYTSKGNFFVHPSGSGSSSWIHQYSIHIAGRGFCGANRLYLTLVIWRPWFDPHSSSAVSRELVIYFWAA